jgi:anti-sigma regulatory factor (Ser/Thr protein kinase)
VTGVCQAPTSAALQTHLELAALPSAVPCARGHVRSVAHEWGLPQLADTAELLASELVTNAVRASQQLTPRADLPSVPVVHLWLACDHHQHSLVIHVWDANSQMPLRRDATPDAESGRGLLLVDTLSAGWGTYRKDDGKIVWAMISRMGHP